jgi:hypothetical protein
LTWRLAYERAVDAESRIGLIEGSVEEMALFFGNASGVDAFVSLIWDDNSTGCGPFSSFRKGGWWRVTNGQTRNLWNIDLRTVNAVGAFFAGQFLNGQGLTWGDLGVNNEVLVRPGIFNQCYDDLTGCTQTSRVAVLAFNTAPNTLIRLLPQVSGEPPWEEFVFD